MSLSDPTELRTWEYVVRTSPNRSHRYTINANLTGAVVGDQLPLHTTFRAALAIITMWNLCYRPQFVERPYRLLIPNEAS